MAPPFRHLHIGSLMRPQELLDARNAAGIVPFQADSTPEIKKATETAIAEVVKKQLARHVRPITSGEFERYAFIGGFHEKIKGLEVSSFPMDMFRTGFGPAEFAKKEMGMTTNPSFMATGKIERTKSAYMDDWLYLRSLLPQEQWKECKLTIPPPTRAHISLKHGNVYTPESGYSSVQEYFSDLCAVYRAEIKDLYEAGLRDIQIDDPYLTFFSDHAFTEGMRTDGDDPDAAFDLYIWVHQQLLQDRPKDASVGIHLCRGNYGKQHFASGSYDKIVEKLFNDLDYDTYYLEYDTERAGNFEPLKHLPVGKNVVLGLVSTKLDELEDIDACVARVNEAADIIAKAQGRTREQALDCLAVSPQCGFASASSARHLSEERMWEKLDIVRQIAKKVWGDEVE